MIEPGIKNNFIVSVFAGADITEIIQGNIKGSWRILREQKLTDSKRISEYLINGC